MGLIINGVKVCVHEQKRYFSWNFGGSQEQKSFLDSF